MQLTGRSKIICEKFGIEREPGNIADINIYALARKLVNNAVVHGIASQVVVQLTKAPASVLITVEDNGKGVASASPKKPAAINLSNIQSRDNYFYGRMVIDPKPGEGTTVNIKLIIY